MGQCPSLILKNLCDLPQYLPFQLNAQMVVSFFFGILVVVVFSIDHYKVPTYAKTTIGEFIELAPKSLTSHSRYIKGLSIYVALMLGFYVVLLAIGPAAMAPILPFLSEKNVDSSIWPLAATSIITLIGSGNDKYLGRLEGWLRSIAHEAAYIPSAVTNLSGALDESFPLTEEELRAAGELTPATESLIRGNQEGSQQNWIRAKYLYSRLEQLRDRDDQFKSLMRQPENERAFKFVQEQRDALAKDVNRNDSDEAPNRRIDAFKNALAVFLASILWRGCGTDYAVRTKLSALRLNVSTFEPRSPATFMFRLFAYLGVVTLAWMFVFQIRQMQWHDASEGQKWHLTLAFLVFLLTAFFVTRWREKRLTAGEWKYSSDAILGCAVLCALGVGGISVVVTFALHQGGVWRFYAMSLVGFAMALLSAFLFQILMRWAATSPPTNAGVAAGLASAVNPFDLIRTAVYAGSLYAIVAFVAAFGPLYWMSQFWIVWGTPQQIIESATDSISNIKAAYKDTKDGDKWLTDFVAQSTVYDLAAALNKAKQELGSNVINEATIKDITDGCDALGDLTNGKKLFKPGCVLNDVVTRTLPEGSSVLPFIYKLQGQISSLPPKFDVLKSYGDIPTAVRSEWKNALLASLIWAVMAAVFAVSALLYRRHMLWDSLASKKLPGFVPQAKANREAWLRQPLDDMGMLSPLEALLYPAFRARLADHMNVQPEPPRLQVVA